MRKIELENWQIPIIREALFQLRNKNPLEEKRINQIIRRFQITKK